MSSLDALVVADAGRLEISKSGSITGPIHIRYGAKAFPDAAWNDFPVVVLSWWIAGLLALRSSRAGSFRGRFLDGPVSFTVEKRNARDELVLEDHGRERRVGEVELDVFLRSAVRCAQIVLGECQARGWSNSDISTLKAAIAPLIRQTGPQEV